MSFCTDADILAVDPEAQRYLPKSEQAGGTFDRVRAYIYERILHNLARRSRPITEADLQDPTELKLAEVYGCLAELLFKAASRAGGADADWYTQEAVRYRQMHDVELESPLSVTGDTVPTVGSIRMRRC